MLDSNRAMLLSCYKYVKRFIGEIVTKHRAIGFFYLDHRGHGYSFFQHREKQRGTEKSRE